MLTGDVHLLSIIIPKIFSIQFNLFHEIKLSGWDDNFMQCDVLLLSSQKKIVREDVITLGFFE